MRTSDIAYVPQGAINIQPLPPLETMTLQEITKNYLRTCIKSNGKVSVCMKDCKNRCIYGEQAAILLGGNSNNLNEKSDKYEGSLLQNARMNIEMNKKINSDIDDQPIEQKPPVRKLPTYKGKGGGRWKGLVGWYDEAKKSGDPITWIMEKFNVSQAQAKRKLYNYEYRYFKQTPEQSDEKITLAINSEPVVKEDSKEPSLNNSAMVKIMECKLEELMDKQMVIEEKMKKEQENLDIVKKQIDAICMAIDVFKSKQ